MKMNPLVSIVIPVYNGSNYLREAIDSALAQTYKNIEIIVVNDGSKDDGATEAIALSYGDRIRYFSKENGGVSTALNKGISEMRGEYFSWLSHDDKYTPTKIESHINVMNEENRDCIFVCGSAFIDKDSNLMKKKSRYLESGYYPYDKMMSAVFGGSMPGGCALLIPKKHFDRFGVFNTQMRFMQDTDMWYRFLAGGVNFVCHREDLGVLSRIHGQQVTFTSKHLYRKDLAVAGPAMVERLANLPVKDTHLLKAYMYLCCREQNDVASRMAYKILLDRQTLSFADRFKYGVMSVYGRLRPLLVKCYYLVFYGVKVRKAK